MSNRQAYVRVFVMLVGLGAYSVWATAPAPFLYTTPFSVTPDVSDPESCWEYRQTTTFANDSVGRAFVGAVDAGAYENAISMLTPPSVPRVPILSHNIIAQGLTPANVYAKPYDSAGTTVPSSAYNARVWELDYFVSGTNAYVAAILQVAGEAGIGGSQLAVININNPQEAYFASARSLENESTTGVGTVSKFLKVISGSKGSDASKRLVFVAVGDPASGEFDTSQATVGLRAFALPEAPITSNALVEVAINGGSLAGKGLKLGNAPTMMSTRMRKLTSMAWNQNGLVLYLGGHMSDSTLGICAFHMNSSNVLEGLNNQEADGGTILQGSGSDRKVLEMSKVHSLKILKNTGTGGSASYLVVQASSESRQRSVVFVLQLNSQGGLLNTGTADTAATSLYDTSLATNVDGTYIASPLCGGQPAPVASGVPVMNMCVTTAQGSQSVLMPSSGAESGLSVFVSPLTADPSTGEVTNLGTWSRSLDSVIAGRSVSAVMSDGWLNVWYVLDRSTMYYIPSPGGVDAFRSAAFGLANIKSSAERVFLRTSCAADLFSRELVMTAPFGTDSGTLKTSQNFTFSTAQTAIPSEVVDATSPLYQRAIWDIAIMPTGDRFYLLNTICDTTYSGTTGGQAIVKIPADGSAPTSISSAGFSVSGYTGNVVRANFFKDGHSVISRCVKIVAGTNPSTGLPVLFCFMPSAVDGDVNYFNGESSYDVIKVLNADLTDPGISCSYHSAIGSMSGNIQGVQSAYWDSRINRLYVGARKSDGDDPALSVFSLDSGNLVGQEVFSNGYVSTGSPMGSSARNIYKIATMHLPSQTLLLVAGSKTLDSDGIVGQVFAFPVFSGGLHCGLIQTVNSANVALDYMVTATATNLTWNDQENRGDLFHVGGQEGVLWNYRAAVLDLHVEGNTVFATVATPPGVEGVSGVFACTAIVDPLTHRLQGWSPWFAVGGFSSSTQSFAFDASSARMASVEALSGKVLTPAWMGPGSLHGYDKLVAAFNRDLSGNGGIYNVAAYELSDGLGYGNSAGIGYAAANLVVATGNKRVALAHVYNRESGYSIRECVHYNPGATEASRYKSYLNDPVIEGLGFVYCSAVSRTCYPVGWLFVAGQNGVAVLRDPVSGKGWSNVTGSGVPTDLNDGTGTGVGIADMEWLKLADIPGPIYSMTTVFDPSLNCEVLLAQGPRGIYSLLLDPDKFKATNPIPLVVGACTEFSDSEKPDERVWSLKPVVRGKGYFAVGTTNGLFLVQYDSGTAPAITVLTEIVDGDGASLGPVASIADITEQQLINAANTYTIDCLVTNARSDTAAHYRSSFTINYAGAITAGPTAATRIASLDRMTTQILSSAGVSSYFTGVPNRQPAVFSVLPAIFEGSIDPVSDGSLIADGATVTSVTTIPCDGARMAAINGIAHVWAAQKPTPTGATPLGGRV